MPPKQIFDRKDRPKGLEFAACEECNGGTSHSDLVAAMMARSLPSPDGETYQREVVKIFSAVANNVPGLLQEMDLPRGAEKLARKRYGIPEGMHPLRADGPIPTRHMLTFAAKLGFALHFETTGQAIPPPGGVQVMWFSNLQALNGEIPVELTSLLPQPLTLKQGRKSVGNQFQYSYAKGEQDHMLFFASFRTSFAVAGITATDRSLWLVKAADKFPIYIPGVVPLNVTG
jgi:hypothetical protein